MNIFAEIYRKAADYTDKRERAGHNAKLAAGTCSMVHEPT